MAQIPLTRRGLVKRRYRSGSRVVAQSRQSAHRLGCLVDRPLYLLGVAHVDLERNAVDLCSDLLQRSRVCARAPQPGRPPSTMSLHTALPMPEPPPVTATHSPAIDPLTGRIHSAGRHCHGRRTGRLS